MSERRSTVFDPISSNEHLDESILEHVHPGLTVYAGPMFSGKSRMLINAIDSVGIRFSEIARRATGLSDLSVSDYVIAFTPTNDTRGAPNRITSRGAMETELSYPAVGLKPHEPWRMLGSVYHDKPFVFIDEGNFWGNYSEQGDFIDGAGFKETVQLLVEQGREVYVAGLSANYRNEPFGAMGDVLAIADHRPELKAWTLTGQNATRTQRITNARPSHYDEQTIVVGDSESYSPREPVEHRVPGKRAHLARVIEGYLRSSEE